MVETRFGKIGSTCCAMKPSCGLLGRSWIASHVNASVRNAAEFDVIAQKATSVPALPMSRIAKT